MDGGRCWGCGETGHVTVLVSSARATIRQRITAAQQRAQKAATFSDRQSAAAALLRKQIPDFDQAHAGAFGQAQAVAPGEAVIAVRDGGNLDQAVDHYDYR